MAVSRAREANPRIKIGVCGEHGGDPGSIEFFHSLGVDYVSVSPARIPVAQLALAQARLKSASQSEACSFTPPDLQEENHAAAENVSA
jgi:pyruvate,orthophosphate dikinase